LCHRSLALLRSGVWQFYVTCFVLGLVGNGAAHLAYSRSISTWFQRRLGTALAFVMGGAGLGAMILPVVKPSSAGLAGGWPTCHSAVLRCCLGYHSVGITLANVGWLRMARIDMTQSGRSRLPSNILEGHGSKAFVPIPSGLSLPSCP
jgi:MFS family permease